MSEFEDVNKISFEMTAYLPKELKLSPPCIIWVGTKSLFAKNSIPILKFQNDKKDIFNLENLVSVSIDLENPTVLDKNIKLNLSNEDVLKIKKWISCNYIPLMKLWNEEISYRVFGNIVCCC